MNAKTAFVQVFLRSSYNSAKDVPHFCPKGLAARRKWGLGQITGGEHISRLARREARAIGKLPQRKVCLWQTLIEGIIINHSMIQVDGNFEI